jgi:hypothetical protein
MKGLHNQALHWTRHKAHRAAELLLGGSSEAQKAPTTWGMRNHSGTMKDIEMATDMLAGTEVNRGPGER